MTNRIDEISKKVLGSYVTKASRDAGVRKQLAGIAQNKRDNTTDKKQEFQHDDEAWAHTHKAEKRQNGISKAIKKLTKENVEQIEEISRKVLGSYVKKATTDIEKKTYAGAGHDSKGVKYTDPNHLHHSERGQKLHKAVQNRKANIVKAVDRLTKEAVESVEEISKTTLSSYIKKGDRSMDNLNGAAVRKWRSHEEIPTDDKKKEAIRLGDKADRRAKFLNKADIRIKTSEAVEEAVKAKKEIESGNKGYGYHGQASYESIRDNGKQHDHEATADKKYAATHKKIKAITGSDDTKVKHYLDSQHGRHLAGNENNHEYVKKDFKTFEKHYKADNFNEGVGYDKLPLQETEQSDIDSDEETGEVRAFSGKKKAKKDKKSAYVSKSNSVAEAILAKYVTEKLSTDFKNYVKKRSLGAAKAATKGAHSLAKTALLRGIVK